MRYKSLKYDNKVITNTNLINKILKEKDFNWLIDSEIEDAEIEITKNTLIWVSGNFYVGDWFYGIFKSGNFYGNFLNGIFENGVFSGKWVSGIKK